ncbi:hypothetical protein B0H13DRAFT_2073021 [Mycena leptocephala]|nr:hypothetical protein B0H13DRAFT_2073021 [Mycena leptocephala]
MSISFRWHREVRSRRALHHRTCTRPHAPPVARHCLARLHLRHLPLSQERPDPTFPASGWCRKLLLRRWVRHCRGRCGTEDGLGVHAHSTPRACRICGLRDEMAPLVGTPRSVLRYSARSVRGRAGTAAWRAYVGGRTADDEENGGHGCRRVGSSGGGTSKTKGVCPPMCGGSWAWGEVGERADTPRHWALYATELAFGGGVRDDVVAENILHAFLQLVVDRRRAVGEERSLAQGDGCAAAIRGVTVGGACRLSSEARIPSSRKVRR